MAGVIDLTAVDSAPVKGKPILVDLTHEDGQSSAGQKRPRSALGADDRPLASLDRTEVATQLANLLTCPICLDAPMTQSGSIRYQFPSLLLRHNFRPFPVSVTLCGHLFCGPCIAKCAESLKQCPTCKAKLKKGSAHRIFL